MQRRLSAALIATIVLLAAFAPSAFAECMTWPLEATEQPRVAHAFVGTVTGVEQQEMFEAGSGQFRYVVTLRTERVYRGSVPDEMEMMGLSAGCSFIDVSALAEGETVFVASERLVPGQYETELGNVLVWQKVGSGWVFYESALGYGQDAHYYSPAARTATTTAAILRLLSKAPLPDTAIASQSEERAKGPFNGITSILLAFTVAFGVMYRRRQPTG